uniref:GPI-GlcNAc transferase complex PIG-H component conserved domain-containing protein n=1 Tax=Leersia perrieri TaxID=77586 RepID=A0A0D9WD75_9ORYZ
MEQEGKGEVSSGIYTYNHHCDNGFDIHEIFVKRSRFRVLLSYIGMVFLLASVSRPFLSEDKLSPGSSVWSITFGILVAKCLQYKPVKKESVVIMPTFGVLKPLLNECVTPVTCYWSLSLLLCDEEELMLVFQKSRPPVKMLVPVWKALGKFLNSECQTCSAVSEPGSQT